MAAGKPPKPPIPWWGWVCAGMCILIPFVALGGAIPGAIGAGGAGGCVAVARHPTMSMGARVGICVAITIGCWALFLGIGIGIALWQASRHGP